MGELDPGLLQRARDAATRAEVDSFRELLGAHPELVRAACDHGGNILHDAAYGGSVEICTLLVEAGADTSRLRENECAPDAPHCGPGSQTPLAMALECNRTDAARYLASIEVAPDNLWMAASLGNLERIEAHVAADGALHSDARDPNKAGDDAFVLADALVGAAHQKHNTAALLLLDRGADPSGRDQFGMTAAHYAVQGNLELLRVLIERGADLGLCDFQFDATPRGWAEYGGHLEVVRFFQELDTRDRPQS